MSRRAWIELVVFAGLVLAGAGARVFYRELPNFAPIAAISLFAGYYFRSAVLAVLTPLLAMLASDLFIGGYEWQMMLVVYGMLVLPVAFRGPLRRWLRFEKGRPAKVVAALGGLLACSLLSSLLFFLATNFAWWPWSTMYEHNWAGLLRCYENGLPFFRHTLAGDLFFGTMLFGGYAWAVAWGWAEEPDYQLASSPTFIP
ncbi:MAG: DUF6580 family putative transport protein [Pirellulaceae bacterium]|nr:DUF6580 family putative transport protein [Pirellulaceae bacterium]